MSMKNHQAVPSMWHKSSNGFQETTHDSDSSSDEEPQVRMRVGEMYQAKVPQWQEKSEPSKQSHSKEGMLIWSPTVVIPEEKLEAYCQIAKEKHHYNLEQALGMLFWHKHDTKKSLHDMQNFTPMPDDWSEEDRVLFEQAYTFHGKNFRKIQQLIPDKEIGQLVKHYYNWKKTRARTSLMDKQASKRQHENDSDGFPPEEDENSLLDEDDQKPPPAKVRMVVSDADIKHKLPKGIQLSSDDITLVSKHAKGAEGHLATLDDNLVELKRLIQMEKQECGKLASNTAPPSPLAVEDSNGIGEWSKKEGLLAHEGVKRFGEDFKAISAVLGTKTAKQVEEYVSTQEKECD